MKEGSGRLVFQKIQQIVCFTTVRHGCVWQCCFSADCGRSSSSAGISLEGSKDSRFFPYFSAMTPHQRAAAAVREGGPCSRSERAVEPSRREPPLHPVMSSKTIFCDNLPRFKKKCLDLLIEYSCIDNRHVFMVLKTKWLLGWCLTGWVRPGTVNLAGIPGKEKSI